MYACIMTALNVWKMELYYKIALYVFEKLEKKDINNEDKF